MRIEFAKLFEVILYHTYYTSGISRDFVVEPTALCRGLMGSYGLLFKRTESGFVVLYEVARDELDHPKALRPIEEAVRFSFIMKQANPYLLNYSSLPLKSMQGSLYRLQNMNDNRQGEELLLSSATDKNHLSGADRIEVKPQLFQYRYPTEKSFSEIEIIDELGAVAAKETVFIAEGIFTYTVDLTGRPPGKYSIRIDGVKELDFYASDELIRKNAFGIIDIFSNDQVPEAYRFVAGSENAHTKYLVRLERRQTYWKYHVSFKYYERDKKFDPEKLSINHPDSSIIFDSQEVFDEAEAIPKEIFISDKELSLTEAPVKGIDLKLKKSGQGGGDGNTVDLRKNLPNPSVRSVKPDEAANKVYSEIFVYL